MTQEEKTLLLEDLCMRLPYGVIIQDSAGRDSVLTIGHADLISLFYNDEMYGSIRPYLRPMSSMTKEEKEQMRDLWIGADTKIHATRLIDFYNKLHFDYRGLIEKDLALEASEKIYK